LASSFITVLSEEKMKKQKRRTRRIEPDKQDFKLDEILGLEVPIEIDWQVDPKYVEHKLAEVNAVYDVLRKNNPEVDADYLMNQARKIILFREGGKIPDDETSDVQ